MKRREIKKTEPIRCIIDTANDPHELSLDENVTLENKHPADQFEAFKKLAEERGFGAEEIAARFGVTPHVVWQRLRLGHTALEDHGALDFPFCGDNPDPCLHFIEFLVADTLPASSARAADFSAGLFRCMMPRTYRL